MVSAAELEYAPMLKLKRAEHHINDLSGRIDAFLAERPFKLMVHIRSKAGQFALRTKTEKAIPPDFSLIIGDATHNLRSALDLTLFGMVGGRTKSPERVQFPFPHEADGLERAVKGGQVEFAGKKVAEAVRLLKPYPTGNRLLSGIHALDIRDKHRLLVLSRFIPTVVAGTKAGDFIQLFLGMKDIHIPSLGIKGVPDGVPITLAAAEGDDLFTGRLTGGGIPDMEGEAAIQPSFVISFGEDQPFAKRPVVETIMEAKKEVQRAIDALVAAFLDPDNALP